MQYSGNCNKSVGDKQREEMQLRNDQLNVTVDMPRLAAD